jgi:hypothetical protein
MGKGKKSNFLVGLSLEVPDAPVELLLHFLGALVGVAPSFGETFSHENQVFLFF